MKIEFNSKYFIENSNGVSANEEILNIISSFLDEKRYKHCLSVGTLAYKIAISNNLKDPIKYYFAGIVHDIGKNLDSNSEYINKYLSEEEKKYPKYMYHQFLGYYLVKEIFSLDDEYILNAIKYHCSGRKNMSAIEKIIYSSDKIDPLRGYDSSYMIEAMLNNFETGFILVLGENRKFINNKKLKYSDNKLTEECYEYYLK